MIRRSALILKLLAETNQNEISMEIDKENEPTCPYVVNIDKENAPPTPSAVELDKENAPTTPSAMDMDRENSLTSPSVIEKTPSPSTTKKQLQILKQSTQTKPFTVKEHVEEINIVSKTVCLQPALGVESNKLSSSRSSSVSSSSTSSSSSSSSSSSNDTKTPETLAIPGPSTSNLRSIPDRPCYNISPINTDESDVDLSDSDPTYKNTAQIGVRISSTSSSSSDTTSPSRLDVGENTSEKKKTRKRKRNPGTWKQNKAKILRNSGKAYKSVSKSKKNVPARCMKDSCSSKCRLKCLDNVNEHARAELFQHYWKLGNLDLQRAYIRTCMVVVEPRYRYTNAQRPRLPNNAFYFTVNGKRIRVCKLFFINTLDISDRQLRTVKKKTNSEGFLEPERRGKHENKKTVDPQLIEQIKRHIETIPRIESHYLRATTNREYITDSKTIKDLCKDFNNGQKEKNLPQAEYWLYLKTFNTEYDIGFFQPKKDRCETCVAYQLAPENTKSRLKSDYDKHLNEKDLCRKEKKNDRQVVDETHICSVFDLQSVMLCPSPDYFYYCSKINCLNFTITELKTGEDDGKSYGDVYCYFWDETQGQRGANEIGSCVYDYLEKLSKKNLDKKFHVTFYSDNCTGQNKNKMIACLYSYAVTHFDNIESITHKYLIKGHTHNEADNVHSLIEKEIKKNQKAGPIYIPLQFATLIKSARKFGKPFMVNELSYEFFLNLKHLQEEWAYNFNENTNKEMILWNDIKVLKFAKKEKFCFYYKTSYADEEFSLINMRPKRKKMLPYEEIVLRPLYENPLELKENKKKDLKELVRKNLIPVSYATYYKSL